MMKIYLFAVFMLLNLQAFAESPCDIRPGTSVGIKVVEFASGNAIHSKIPMRETTAEALLEEMTNLQDMGICEEKIVAQKCILKFEKYSKTNYITMYRGANKWNTWNLSAKNQIQDFIKRLKKVGFCS